MDSTFHVSGLLCWSSQRCQVQARTVLKWRPRVSLPLHLQNLNAFDLQFQRGSVFRVKHHTVLLLLQKRAKNQAQLTGEQAYQQSESGLHSPGSFAGICERVIYIRTPRSKLWSKPVDGNYRESNFNNTLQDMKKMFQAMGLWRQQWINICVRVSTSPPACFQNF